MMMKMNLYAASKALNEVSGLGSRQISRVRAKSIGSCNRFHSFSGGNDYGGVKDAANVAANKHNIKKNAPVKILSTGKSASAGRNSSGRITIFHRGGGAKRVQRSIDLKRSTSSMGIVERIEYDPNRSSRIALVRWIEGVRPKKLSTTEGFSPPREILEPIPTTIRGQFSFCALPGKAVQEKIACVSPGPVEAYVVDGLSTSTPVLSKNSTGSKKTCARNVFLSAFSSPKAREETTSLLLASSSGFPRVAVSGAKPAFFVPGMKDELSGKSMFSLSEVQKGKTNSIQREHRIKRKGALSWQSLKHQDNLGFVAAAEHNKSTIVGKGLKDVNRAPVTYIIASHRMEVGTMVMNCDWTRPTTSNF
uniref:60S ribosomal protein L2, mitochondrial n=1 Tax=Francoa sonchifolia TaxID=23250 RepID=A0A0G2YKU9_9ROSI|nr:ribosomal protein L2 [Francoa sonchifolia]